MTDLATIILLLGSYDVETKKVLEKIKEEIAKISIYLVKIFLRYSLKMWRFIKLMKTGYALKSLMRK